MSELNILIAISGKYGSGKDAAAAIICKYFPSFERLAFADRLKETVAAFAGVDLELLYTREGKSLQVAGFDVTLGRMLQFMGDDMKTRYGKDIWTNLTMAKAESQARSIITDCRFLVEAEAVTRAGRSLLLRIEGDPVGLRAANVDGRDLLHASETDLDDYPFAHVIQNDGTLEEYERKVLAIVVPWLYSFCR